MLSSGHSVTGFDSERARRLRVKRQVLVMLKEMRSEGLLREDAAQALDRFTIGASYSALAHCNVIIEAITEDLRAKRKALQESSV